MAQASSSGMHVNVSGHGSPALVFVHGFACDANDWAAQTTALASLSTVISCDLISHGRSVVSAEASTIAQYGAAVAALLEERDLAGVILVGHSMGCRVSLACYAAAPERIAGLVLLDGSRIGSGDPAEAAYAMTAHLAGEGYDTFIRAFFDAMFVPSSDPVVHAAILERAQRLPASVGRPLLVDLARWDAGDMDAAISRITVPVLAIQTTTLNLARERVPLAVDGESAWLDLVRSHQPSAQVATIPGAGHFPHIEQAHEVTALIADFFEAVTARA